MMKISLNIAGIVILFSILKMSDIYAGTNQSGSVTIAISDFKNSTGSFRNDQLETAVPEMLKTELVQAGGVTVVERSKIEAVLAEQALAQTGVLNSEEAQKMGRLLNAEYVLTGEFTRVGDRFRIDAHIVRVETGEVNGEKVTGPNEEAVEAMVRALARNLINNLTGHTSRVEVVSVRDYYAKWIVLAGVGTGVAAAAFNSTYQSNYDSYKKARRLNEFDGYYDKANSAYKARNWTIGATAALVTTGVVLWLESKSSHNQIFAQKAGSNRPFFAINPFYNAHTKAVGFRLAMCL